MSENRLFIKADVSYSDRWLYQSETFRKQKNFNIALPNEREFMTGECIVTDKDDTAYSIDELVNLLNYFNRCTVSNKEFMELKEENEHLKLHFKKMEKLFQATNKENEQLKSEINMLKTTIGRNEAYIKRLTEKSEWHC